jgi:hypothetical protein
LRNLQLSDWSGNQAWLSGIFSMRCK